MMRGSSRSRRDRKRISLRVEESVERDTQCPLPAAIIAALHPLQYYFFGLCGCALALDVLRVNFQGPQSCHQAFSTLAFLLGMLSVSIMFGDITSILFGVPGEPLAAAVVLDGHPMAKAGQAGRAFTLALTL